MGSLHKNIQLMLEFPRASFLVLHFSCSGNYIQMFNYNLLFLKWGAGRICLKFPRYFFQKFLNAFHYNNCHWNYLSCCSGTKTVVSLTDILLWVFRETATSSLILTYKLIWFFEKVSVVKRSGFLIAHLWFCFGGVRGENCPV